MNGLLVIDKPSGMSSHDVVSRARRILRTKRIGHTGTLDPFATGVLPLVVGQATRLASLLLAEDKAYDATLKLGVTTDTLDLDGAVVQERPLPPGLTRGDIEAALPAFRGQLRQVPPMYSALKVQGRPLYAYAREGIEIERPARDVQVMALELTGFAPPMLELNLTCTKGTYVRVLAAELGEALGCGAHLTALRRTRTGSFDLSSALTLEALEACVAAGELPSRLIPMTSMLPQLFQVELRADELGPVSHGNALRVDAARARAFDDWHRAKSGTNYDAAQHVKDGEPVLLVFQGEVVALALLKTQARGGIRVFQPSAVLVE